MISKIGLLSLIMFGTVNFIHCEETSLRQQNITKSENIIIRVANSLEEVRKIKNPNTEFKDWFLDAVKNKCVWLAYYQDTVVGIIALRVYNNIWPKTFANGKDRMELLALYVLPTMRKHGIGRALCETVENEAIKRGAEWLTLNAFEHAIPFYKKLGYTEFCNSKANLQKKLGQTDPLHPEKWVGECD